MSFFRSNVQRMNSQITSGASNSLCDIIIKYASENGINTPGIKSFDRQIHYNCYITLSGVGQDIWLDM